MIERIKTIFYRPDFFRDQNFTTNQALGFYSLTILAVVGIILLSMLPMAFTFVQSIRSGEWQTQKAIVQSLYPEDLKLTVNRDTVSTNQVGPVVIPLPESWTKMAECGPRHCKQNELPTNLLVIDTTGMINRSDFDAFDTVAILGANEVGFHNPERGETRIFSLKEANFKESFILTAPMFREGIEKGFKALQVGLVVVAFFIPGVLFAGLWIGHLFYALIGALVVWLAANMQGHKLRYGQAYRSTLYLLAVPLLVTILLGAMTGSRVPFVCTIFLFGMVLLNFPKSEKLPEPVKITAADTSFKTKTIQVEEKPKEEDKK